MQGRNRGSGGAWVKGRRGGVGEKGHERGKEEKEAGYSITGDTEGAG